MSTPRIAIIGGGPAGATLGRILHLASIPFTIFESEASTYTRNQGSTLDLHTDTGIAAIKACELYEQFLKHVRYDGEYMAMVDKHNRIYVEDTGATSEADSSGRPEIDRSRLREILIDSIPQENIRWNHRLRSIDDDGTLHFDHGVEKGFDLVVGAEGAWSKVRAKLTDEKPFYTGLGGHGLDISDAQNRYPDLYKLCNRGSLFAFSDGKAIQPQQLGDGRLHLYTWSKRPEDWMETFPGGVQDVGAVRRDLETLFGDWDEKLLKFTQVADELMDSRNLYMLPVGNRFEHRSGFTIIGDAAHLMTPFAGEGVNLAMADAMGLGQAIVKGRRDGELDVKVKVSEEDMFVRAKKAQEETKLNMDNLFREDEEGLAVAIMEMMKDAPEEVRASAKEKIAQGASEKVRQALQKY